MSREYRSPTYATEIVRHGRRGDEPVDAFSASYEDYKEADVAMIVGTDPYETKTVAFTQWLQPGGAKIIQMDPRKTFTAAYAEKNGGVHLQVLPGTDAWAIGVIARYILEQGWEDSEFIENYVVHDRSEIDEDSAWRRRRFGQTYDEWQEAVRNNPELTLEEASKITTVAAEKLQRAAEVAPGHVFSFFHYPGSPGNSVVTGDSASTPQNPRQPFKFGRGKVTRIGSTNLAETMSFVPRNIV